MSSRAATAPMVIIKSPLRQLAGFVLTAFALFLGLSLITYNSADPALNRATAEAATNVGGIVGAYISDMLLQILGFAAAFTALVPMSWGMKMMVGKPVSFVWLRFSVLLFALVFTAFLFSSIEAPVSWPIASGLGGSIGALLHDAVKASSWFPLWWFGGFALSAFTLLIAFGMSFGEWRSIGRLFRYMAMVAVGLYYTIRYRKQHQEELDEDEDEEYDEDEDEYEPSFFERVKEKLFFWRRDEEYDEDEEEYEDDEDEEDEDDDEEEDAAPRRKKKRKVVEKKIEKKAQSSLALPKGDFSLPAIALLGNPPKSRKAGMNESALEQNARLLESVLEDFNVQGQITEIRPGPVVTLYELEPAAGTKSSRVVGLSDDIARSMSSLSARIAVIPGRNAIGIELPNAQRETVYFRELLETEAYDETEANLPLALGKDIGGETVIVDLAKMPHLLVAGTTGSGKSVAINTMIMSLLYKLSPDECKFIMIDPKMLELSVYEGIPHLLTSVVTEPGKAVVALKWTVKEMENRYRLMANLGVRNIENYNKQIREAKAKGKQLTRPVQTGFDGETGRAIIEEVPLEMNELPYIVVIVDEMADLMIVAGKDIESSIQRLAQMARAAGIHLIMATQRPSVDVITGVIKANFPTRISFQVTSRIDSRTILGDQGAEQLLGQGDMLYMAGGGRVTRVHGPFVSDKEVEQVVAYLKTQGEPTYIEEVTKDDGEEMEFGEDGERDELYEQAVAIVRRERKASTSYIQRQLRIGYNRAAMIIEKMEKQGIVTPASAMGKREVIE